MRLRHVRRVGALLILLLAAGLAASPVSRAQPVDPPAVMLPEPLTRDAIRELVARLSDAEVRRLLLAQLDRAAASSAPHAAPGMAPMMGGMETETHRLRDGLRDLGGAAGKLPEALRQAVAPLSEDRPGDHFRRAVLLLAAMLAVGWGAERLIARLVAHGRQRLETGHATGLAAQAGRLLLRLVLDLLGLLAFGFGALLVLFILYEAHGPSRQLVIAGLTATLFVRLVALLARLLLEPDAPGLRLLPFDDGAARRLRAGVVWLAAIYAVADLGLQLLHAWGLPADVVGLLVIGASVVFVAMFLSMVWRNRAPIAVLIRGPEPSSHLRRLVAELWPVLMTAYVVLIFGARTAEQLSGMSLRSYAGIGSLLIVIVLPLVDMVLCRLLAAAETTGPYAPVLRRGIHIGVTVAGLVVMARLWGLDLFDLTTRRMGGRFSEALLSIAVTLLVAYLAWELVKAAIDRRLEREADPAAAEPGEEGGRGASRLRTILPLVRGFLLVTISAMALMVMLASLGVNIGPLLAGAGVVGIAVGFGAQTLVRDVVSGLFFLLDDAFRLGEYIDVGDVKGTVEKIGLRSMQLRHHRGALNTVPYGAIRRLINESRDWVIVRLEFRLTYDTDLTKVKKILKQIGRELAEDPELGPGLLQPLKSQGVMSTEDSALVVRAKFMAKPDDRQYVIRREAYNRILKAFAEHGIKFAHRQVTVFVPPGTGGPSAAVGGAAGLGEPAPDLGR
jgi:small-conductance mechanosensitive channel